MVIYKLILVLCSPNMDASCDANNHPTSFDATPEPYVQDSGGVQVFGAGNISR